MMTAALNASGTNDGLGCSVELDRDHIIMGACVQNLEEAVRGDARTISCT